MSGSSRAACSEFPLGCVRTVLGRRYQLEMTATAQSEGTRCKVNAMAVVGVGKLACVPASRARRGWRQEQEFLRASCYEQIGRSRTGRGDELRTDDSLAKIFWSIDPVGAECFRAIAESLENADSFQATRIEHLLKHSPRGPIYAYGELRKIGAELQPDSQAAAIIQGWCELADQQRQLNEDQAPEVL